MSENDGLICAYALDGKGGAQELDWDGVIASWGNGLVWVHLHLEGERTARWIREESGLPVAICDALLQEDIRPRCVRSGDGLLVNLRGVNLNPGADPEDMVGIRGVFLDNQIVTVRRRRLMAVQDIRDALAEGRGPTGVGGLLFRLADGLTERMRPVIDGLDERIDDLEDRMLDNSDSSFRSDLWEMRHEAILLRRYIGPQREALTRLSNEDVPWINETLRARLREASDRITRYVEELDSGRERAAILQDELSTRLGEQMNRNMYVLSVIAAIFLPLSLLTGLLGINVAGIPGEKWPWAFAFVTASIVVIGILEYFLFRRMKWI